MIWHVRAVPSRHWAAHKRPISSGSLRKESRRLVLTWRVSWSP